MSELVPASGSPEGQISRLREYISGVDPDWASRVRPASNADIARYLQISGVEHAERLPRTYLQFLHGMGEDSAGLFDKLRISMRLGELLSLYDDYQRFEPYAIQPTLPLVGKYFVGDQLSLDLRHDRPEPDVAETTNGEWTSSLADSWEKFVVQAAVLYVELRRRRYGYWYSSALADYPLAERGERAAAVVRAVAEKQEMQLPWVNDACHAIAMGEGATLFGKVNDSGGVLLYAFASDERILQRIDSDIGSKLGAATGGALVPSDGVLKGIE